MAPIVQLWEFKDKGQKTEDRGWWLLNAKRLPAQSFVFCPLSFVLELKTDNSRMLPISNWPCQQRHDRALFPRQSGGAITRRRGAPSNVALPAPTRLDAVKAAYGALSAEEREAFKKWLAEQG